MRAALLLVLLALTVPAAAAGQPPSPTPTPANGAPAGPDAPRIVAVYPNPTFPGDRGEFIVIDVPGGTPLGTLAIADGETAVGLPDRELAGRVAVATDPVVANLTDAPVVLVGGPLRLANRGERVVLRGGDGVLDTVTYSNAPEGRLYRRTPSGWTWLAPGATSFPVRSGRASSARLFVLPDTPAAVLPPLRDAERRLWLAGYTFTSRRVADALCAARDRGVDVRVLVELEPVGGMTAVGAHRLDRLAGCGVAVRVIGGPRARYAFHHAKYAVADDRAVVLTENWKPAGVGGRSSRGWGVVLLSPGVADALAETFAADAGWRDARPWAAARRDRRFAPPEPPANGTFPAAFTPVPAEDVGVEVVVAPDNAERRTVALLDGARTGIRVIQVSVGGERQPFVRALIRAARRGVSVKLLLASVWYVREDNRAVAEALNELAREEGLPLDVRLAAPHGRYGKIHAKAAVVDGERVLLGSLNWNNASARRNREVDVVLHSSAAARYYGGVFDADWQGGRWRVPAGLVVVAAALALAAAGFAARRIEFDPGGDEGVVPAPDGPVPPGPGLP